MTTDTSRPTSVERAALCLWISAGLALLVTMAQVTGWVATVGTSVGLTAIIGLFTAGFLALMAAKINVGRGWARWTFAVIYVIGTLWSAVLVLAAPALFRALPTILQANILAQFVLQTAALVLIFTGTSRHWFKAKHVAAVS